MKIFKPLSCNVSTYANKTDYFYYLNLVSDNIQDLSIVELPENQTDLFLFATTYNFEVIFQKCADFSNGIRQCINKSAAKLFKTGNSCFSLFIDYLLILLHA